MNWPDFAKRLLLADGRITDVETRLLRRAVLADGAINRDEVAFLIDLKRSAAAVAPAFDRFLFAVLKRVVLVDGIVSDAEAAWLEKTLFADKVLVTDMTIRFLRELREDADGYGPRFGKLYAKWAGTGKPPVTASTPARTRPAPLPARPASRPRTRAGRS
jgi:hypothetical protein